MDLKREHASEPPKGLLKHTLLAPLPEIVTRKVCDGA